MKKELIEQTDNTQEEASTTTGRVWVLWGFSAAICFTACNTAISEITTSVGPLCIFYFAPGSIIASLIYHIIKSYKNPAGKIWVDQNIMIDG